MPSPAKGRKTCPSCHRKFKNGLWKHEIACQRKRQATVHHQQRRRNGAQRVPDRSRIWGPSVERCMPSPDLMDVDMQQNNPAPPPSQATPEGHGRLYIEIIHHPHSGLDPEIIPLDSPSAPPAPSASALSLVSESRVPWAPFLTRPDFEWAETMYTLSEKKIKTQLAGIHGPWNPNGTAITIRTYDELRGILAKARKYVVEFQSYEFDREFDQEMRHITMYYRDPWEWILELVTDPSLADKIVWYPYQKYLVIDGMRQRLRDEYYSADLWWDMQDRLPHIPGMHHCIFPLLLWLDEGRVTSHTNMYPMLLRALSLPSAIRNGSGNGGSFLAGFMPQIKDHRDSQSRTAVQTTEFALAKSGVYHDCLRRAFVVSIGHRSCNGEAVTCADRASTQRVLYPCIPTTSLDGKEADAYTATRAALATVPCSGCTVRADQLHHICDLNLVFEARTTEWMRRVYEESQNMRYKKDAEAHLQSHGLHAVKNALWEIENSDPYRSISYDLLHSDDLGKFGKHLWPRLQVVLEQLKTKGLLTQNMGKVPRWPGLKHFLNVTSKQMNNGQAYLDIEKCILPCVVQLLPPNSPWVHAIRAHLRFRMTMGLHCISEEQISRKETYQVEYGKYCMKISRQDPRFDWDFPKQHAVYHSTSDIKLKGAPSIYCTRANESIHQENRDSAALGNHRDNDKQVSEIDATKEAMARIRMTVDAYDKEVTDAANKVSSHAGVTNKDVQVAHEALLNSNGHWRLGACRNLVDSRVGLNGAQWIDTAVKQKFDSDLRAFVREAFPDAKLRNDGEEQLLIRRCDCLYIHYTSAEDYTDQVDILRCNPEFGANNEERFDCVNVNLNPDSLDFARLLYVFRCRIPGAVQREEDIALVRLFKRARWRPKTVWDNCRILEDGRTMLILPKYFIRGAHLINAFGSPKEHTTFYLNDVIDSDWFLRAGN